MRNLCPKQLLSASCTNSTPPARSQSLRPAWTPSTSMWLKAKLRRFKVRFSFKASASTWWSTITTRATTVLMPPSQPASKKEMFSFSNQWKCKILPSLHLSSRNDCNDTRDPLSLNWVREKCRGSVPLFHMFKLIWSSQLQAQQGGASQTGVFRGLSHDPVFGQTLSRIRSVLPGSQASAPLFRRKLELRSRLTRVVVDFRNTAMAWPKTRHDHSPPFANPTWTPCIN